MKKIIVSDQVIQPTPIGNIWESKNSIVYGPIVSRRFRYSLGINLFSKKICSLNCTYCDLDTTNGSIQKEFLKNNIYSFPKATIFKTIEKAFRFHRKKKTKIDKITFCGNGEVTLHPNFLEIVNFVTNKRDEYFPTKKIAILTAPTELYKDEVIEALDKIDIRIFKLDASDKRTYNRICRQLKLYNSLGFNEQIEHLKSLSKKYKNNIIISSALVKSIDKNYDNLNSIKNMDAILKKIKPKEYHIHNIDYPIFNNDNTVIRLSLDEMISIAQTIIQKYSIKIKVLHSAKSLREYDLNNYKVAQYKEPYLFEEN